MMKILHYVILCFALLMNTTMVAQALQFDGTDDELRITSNGTGILGDFSAPHDFTIEVRVMFTDPANITNQKILSKNAQPFSTEGFAIETNGTGKIQVVVSYSNISTSWYPMDVTTVPVTTGIYYNVAFTYEHSTFKYRTYLNGVLITELPAAAFGAPSFVPSAVDASMGYSVTWGEYSDVAFDYLRVWDVERTAAEILADMGTEIDCNTSNLIAHLNFNDGVGGGNNTGITNASDCTGNGWDGALSNFAMTGTNSNFIVTTPLAALPVELMAFDAQKIENKVALNWITATEENNAGFDIERSADGETWETLDFVLGHGTTLEEQHYTYDDMKPMIGISYYRLRQVDFDGAFEYSDIISISSEMQNPKSEITLFPNPVVEQFTIQNTKGELTIYSSLGQPVYSETLSNDNTKISMQNLPAGQYIVEVLQQDGMKIVERIIKQ